MRGAIKEDFKERRAAVLFEAAEAGKSIRNARRDFANWKTKMTLGPRRQDGTVTASRKAMEKTINDVYSYFFDSHDDVPMYQLKQDGYVVPSVLPSNVRLAILSVKNCTAPSPNSVRSQYLKNLPPVFIKALAWLSTRYLSECKVPTQWKTTRTVLLYKKINLHDIGKYRQMCLLPVIYQLSTRVILNRIGRTLMKDNSASKQGSEEDSARLTTSTW